MGAMRAAGAAQGVSGRGGLSSRGGAVSVFKYPPSRSQETASPTSTAQNGAPIDNTGTFATVTRKQTTAPSVKVPPNEMTKARSSTRSKARPASAAMKTLGIASMKRVNAGAKMPNSKE